jgi:hypothetical protein
MGSFVSHINGRSKVEVFLNMVPRKMHGPEKEAVT